MTLFDVSGIFYVLVAGLLLALVVALIEYLQHGRKEAARANVSLKQALMAKTRVTRHIKHMPAGTPQSEDEPVPWNGVFTGVSDPLKFNQIIYKD